MRKFNKGRSNVIRGGQRVHTNWSHYNYDISSILMLYAIEPFKILLWNLYSLVLYRELTKYSIVMYIHAVAYIPSGSDHSRSHIAPSWGTSCFRSIERIWSRVVMEGERPPWTQKIWKKTERTWTTTWIFSLYMGTDMDGVQFGEWAMSWNTSVHVMANWIKLLSMIIIMDTSQQLIHTKQIHVCMYLAVHNGWETEIVKNLCTVPPYIHRAIFSLTFIVESIHLYVHTCSKQKR